MTPYKKIWDGVQYHPPTIVTVYIVLVLPVTRASTHPVLLDTVVILHLACTRANVEDMHTR